MGANLSERTSGLKLGLERKFGISNFSTGHTNAAQITLHTFGRRTEILRSSGNIQGIVIGNANQIPSPRLKFSVANHHFFGRIHRHSSAKYSGVNGVVIFFHLNFLHQVLAFRFRSRHIGLSRGWGRFFNYGFLGFAGRFRQSNLQRIHNLERIHLQFLFKSIFDRGSRHTGCGGGLFGGVPLRNNTFGDEFGFLLFNLQRGLLPEYLYLHFD